MGSQEAEVVGFSEPAVDDDSRWRGKTQGDQIHFGSLPPDLASHGSAFDLNTEDMNPFLIATKLMRRSVGPILNCPECFDSENAIPSGYVLRYYQQG